MVGFCWMVGWPYNPVTLYPMEMNVLGTRLESCSRDPLTGFMRDGLCKECPGDRGKHIVCAMMDETFLAFSAERGNDLTTPRPDLGFPGLRPGDKWCICLTRWIEAFQAGVAPKVDLKATHVTVLETVPMKILKDFALNDFINLN